MRVLKLHWDPATKTSDHFALGTTKIFLQRRVWEACTRRQQELLLSLTLTLALALLLTPNPNPYPDPNPNPNLNPNPNPDPNPYPIPLLLSRSYCGSSAAARPTVCPSHRAASSACRYS